MAEKKIDIVLTAAVVIEGNITLPKTKVTVDESVAKNLLERGRATLAGKVNPDEDDGEDDKPATGKPKKK